MPACSAASCSRREATRVSRPSSSATTAPRPGWRSPSSIAANTDLPASANRIRSGCKPTPARPGANRSGCCCTHSTGPASRDRMPATNRVAAAACSVSGPDEAASCSAANARPPPGKTPSIVVRPKGKTGVAAVRPCARSMRAIRSRRSRRDTGPKGATAGGAAIDGAPIGGIDGNGTGWNIIGTLGGVPPRSRVENHTPMRGATVPYGFPMRPPNAPHRTFMPL
jgi:hypothetical protein